MSDQLIVERGGLEKKDKSELQTIVSALGGSASSRARKAELIDQILELSGATMPAAEPADESSGADSADTDTKADPTTDAKTDTSTDAADATPDAGGDDGAAVSDAGAAIAEVAVDDGADASAAVEKDDGPRADADDKTAGSTEAAPSAKKGASDGGGRSNKRGRGRGSANGRNSGKDSATGHPVGPDGEPLADWELEVMADDPTSQGGSKGSNRQNQGRGRGGDSRNEGRNDGNKNEGRNEKNENKNDGRSDNKNDGNRNENKNDGNKNDPNRNDGNADRDDVDPNNRRSRRRGRGRGRERDDVGNEPVSTEPVPVAGALDLREEGYGFLRVDGFLPSKEDVYVSVKQVRQYGLRKGDHLTGSARPANRNEKNPGFHQIESVNGRPPEEAKGRPRFDDLTPLFPDERLVMEMREEPLNMTTRIMDLVTPIGKGQRGLIVSPPKAGKTTIMKDIARAIETNNPDVTLIVLLLDERPEEVTDMRRHLKHGEVAASTFDRPPEEHCAVAELTIERAKRLVETGQDVFIIVDGITRLSRAYNLTAPQTGRAMSGGLDAGALYPPKRFFGAARNLEEGGSLTILATALVETGSRMDEVIFEEFKGTGNMELRLDRRLAEKRIFPAIDIDGSSTRHEELLFDKKQLQQAWKLRRVVSGMADEGSAAAGVEMLVDRLQTFRTNDDFLAEIAKAPSV